MSQRRYYDTSYTQQNNCKHIDYDVVRLYFWIFQRDYKICLKCHDLIPLSEWDISSSTMWSVRWMLGIIAVMVVLLARSF